MRRLHYDPAPLAHVVDDFEGDTSERLTGCKLPAVADPDPDDEPLVYLNAFAMRRRPPKDCNDPTLLCIYNGNPHQPLLWVKAGKYWHAARLETDRKRLFFRAAGCVRAERDKDGFQFYARVYHLRKWVLLLPLALCALLLCLSLSLCSPSGSPDFLSGMTGTAGATSKPVVSVDYAAYDASVDSRWVADSMTQDFRLSLPATCKYAKGKEGGNPIISSPSVMVDLNHDGKYDSDTECVYNAPDKTGYGAFIRPGCEVNRIKLTQPVPAGTYSARTVWRSVLASDGKTPASSTSFDFTLTVE
ncbi:MAG: hypothetical protein Q3X10_05425 [Collinsella sp.]|nr:hypothetical protein [Collinsella sp.]